MGKKTPGNWEKLCSMGNYPSAKRDMARDPAVELLVEGTEMM